MQPMTNMAQYWTRCLQITATPHRSILTHSFLHFNKIRCPKIVHNGLTGVPPSLGLLSWAELEGTSEFCIWYCNELWGIDHIAIRIHPLEGDRSVHSFKHGRAGEGVVSFQSGSASRYSDGCVEEEIGCMVKKSEWSGKLREQGGVPFKNIIGVGEVGISFIVESDDERRYYIITPCCACAASGQAIALGLEYIIICNFFLKLTFRSPF